MGKKYENDFKVMLVELLKPGNITAAFPKALYFAGKYTSIVGFYTFPIRSILASS